MFFSLEVPATLERQYLKSETKRNSEDQDVRLARGTTYGLENIEVNLV